MRSLILIFAFALSLSFSGHAHAQITERARPEEWSKLVPGARFMDRFLPMPDESPKGEVWGAPGVISRYVDNGIESSERSYWGGNILRGNDGFYHLFVCGWPESSPKGHAEWPHSTVYHATASKPTGPFSVVDTIGPGHNPEAFRLEDGRYVLYVIGAYYIADSLNGPWERRRFVFDNRDRPIIEGLTNLSFTRREDGSVLMICRGGGVWISENGISPYKQISDRRIYPPVEGNFEDPVVWRDHVQYHLIVNDWLGRIAYYLRSPDGVHWVTDPGEAYMPGIAMHRDGSKEDWFKYERIKVLQDSHGRAVQANFAVIDVPKNEDKASDNHSSKNIAIPLNPGLLLELLTEEPITSHTKEIKLKIKAEEGFNPHKDVDIPSLRFGSSSEVNFGRGSRVLNTEKDGNDLIVTFEGKGNGITADEFAPKLLGKSSDGLLLYGYARLPSVDVTPPILSAKKPVFTAQDKTISLTTEVENLGQETSSEAHLALECKKDNSYTPVANTTVRRLLPYTRTDTYAETHFPFEKGKEYPFRLSVTDREGRTSLFEFKAIPLP